VPRFENERVTVSNVEPESPADRAGLVAGDRLVRMNGQVLLGRADWQRASIQFDPSEPLVLEVGRNGERLTVTLAVSAGLTEWQRGKQTSGLLAFRLAQAVTLLLGIAVAFRRSSQLSALLGSLFLGSLGTVSLVLPMRLGVFWQALPEPAESLLWLPFTTSAAGGPLFFAFASVFPHRIWPSKWIAVALIPSLTAPAWHLHVGRQLMQDLGPPIGLHDGAPLVFVVNALYAALAIGLLAAHWRTAETLTDQRRIRVLIVGTGIGVVAAVGVFVGYWRNPGADIFTTTHMTVLSLVFLAMPASFAYAILRHQLFDVRLIIRQGLRYALARRIVDSLMPAVAALLVIDVLVHRQEPVASLLHARGWWYSAAVAALLLVRSRREAWLRRIDRRFFRERYDAQRLLTGIADQVSRASSFKAIEHSVVQQVDEALHPMFVRVLRHVPSNAAFDGDTGAAGPTDSGGVRLPASLAVIGVLAALRKPLALSLGDTAWVRHQLPLGERTLLLAHGIELLVPIFSRADGDLPRGLLVLGRRRSEEPYNPEDLALLTTIADAVGALLERSSDDAHGLAECEHCGRCYDGLTTVCPHDNHRLTSGRGTFLINGRYRLESRLGRGGMGAVYAAVDTVLERPVAVKVIRDDLACPLDLSGRFHREARVAAGFSHPHVIRVYDFGVERSGRPFLVMELLEGQTLRERLNTGPALDRREVLHVLRGICSALSAAHARGLVHRDLKPENVYLQHQAAEIVPKVLDFGLAKALDAGRNRPGSTSSGTSAGMLIGTLDYMAPEQVAGDDVNATWDLWAVSVMTYEMLAGRHPFREGGVFGFGPDSGELETGQCVTRCTISPSLDAFLRRALSQNRGDRPESAAAFLAALEQLLA
jgi:hypothetical protein